ncbi:MAG: hypothetical protein QOH04_2092 [Sphingomonadales bacterium]|nr:hypothetical protein [Sphingomonadales bacterium]
MIGLNVILATIIDGMSIIESAFSILRFALSYVGGFIGPYLPQFIVIIGVTISFLLFRLKAGHKIKYGLLEAIFAVVAMISVSGQMSLASGVISPPNITFAGAIYVFIRGLTNIYEGLSGKARKQFDAWFLGRPIEEANSNSAAGK